jgi:hypothetical protein
MTTHSPTRAESGTESIEVPLLGHGRHAHPRKGGCLMELVSATAGGLWSYRPACTPPVLAHVGRIVNDHISPAARPRLAPLIPYLLTDEAQQHRIDLAAADPVVHPTQAATVLIRARLVKPLGADWLEVEARIDLPRSPGWLTEAWRRRSLELHQPMATPACV